VFDNFAPFYERYMKERMAAKCVKCGACESACPQHISIRDWLETIDKEAVENCAK
jgi:predicted aldo/keto reductase-like oxidoreductase